MDKLLTDWIGHSPKSIRFFDAIVAMGTGRDGSGMIIVEEG